MRKHERFDCSFPVYIHADNLTENPTSALVNIGKGGMSCHFPEPVRIGDEIDIQITFTEPVSELSGKVRWCRKYGDHFEIGLEFNESDDPFLARMVKQVCLIEEYRKQQNKDLNRDLTSQQAAKEWIEKYAAEFEPDN